MSSMLSSEPGELCAGFFFNFFDFFFDLPGSCFGVGSGGFF